jgi:hypothetical protein
MEHCRSARFERIRGDSDSGPTPDLVNVLHDEKYRAALSFEGQGPVLDDDKSERSDTQVLEQLDLDGFQSHNA